MPPLSRKQFKKDINMESTHSQHGQAKIRTVMSEFKHGTLHSGSGGKVTSRKQAVAIALSEAGLSRKRRGRK